MYEIDQATGKPMAKTGLYTFGDENDLKVKGNSLSAVREEV